MAALSGTLALRPVQVEAMRVAMHDLQSSIAGYYRKTATVGAKPDDLALPVREVG